MANIKKIKILDNTTYDIYDATAFHAKTTGTVGSASAGTAIAADDITSYTQGTAASLTKTDVSIPNVTSAGSAPSLTVTSTTVANGRNLVTLGDTALESADAVSGSSNNYCLNLSNVLTGVNLTTTSVGSASNWNAGAVPTLGTAISASKITGWTTNTPTTVAYTPRSIPNISVTQATVVTGVTAS